MSESSQAAVVIPLYNGRKWIARTLESVLSQSQPPNEVIIVDDGSEDESREIVRKFAGVILVEHPGKGANSARRFGLSRTTAPLVAFLDQDDLWHPDHLRLLSGLLEQHPDCPAAVAGVCGFHSEDQLAFSPAALEPAPLDPWSYFPFNTITTPGAVLIRRSALEAVGGWPAHFVGVADTYLWLTLSARKPLIQNRAVTFGHREHDTSYNRALRTQEAPKYFEAYLSAWEEALSHRWAAFPQEAGDLQRRLADLGALAPLLRAICQSDPEGLRQSALALEARMSEDFAAFFPRAWAQLFWYLLPSLTIRTRQQMETVFDSLFVHWPTEASNTRRLVQFGTKDLAPWRAFLRYLRNRPSDPGRWALFASIARMRALRVVRRLQP